MGLLNASRRPFQGMPNFLNPQNGVQRSTNNRSERRQRVNTKIQQLFGR